MKSICRNISIYEMQYIRNLDLENAVPEIPVQAETNYARNNDNSEKDSRLLLKLEVGEQGKTECAFYFKLVLAGIFDWEELTPEEAEDEISTEGAEILMSFARTYFHDITEKSGVHGVVLPIIHYDEIYHNRKSK